VADPVRLLQEEVLIVHLDHRAVNDDYLADLASSPVQSVFRRYIIQELDSLSRRQDHLSA
jgi:hypothetical protein